MYSYSGSILRLGLAENRDTWGWTAEFAAPVLLGLPSKAIGTGPQEGALGFGGTYFTANNSRQNTAMIFPKQFYLRFNALGGSKAHRLQLGRFEFLDGSEVVPANATLAALRREE